MEILCNHLSVPVEYTIYAGMVQFKENCLRLGEAALQTSVRKILPILL